MLIRKGIPSKFSINQKQHTGVEGPNLPLCLEDSIRLQCTCPEKAQTTMKSLFNSLLFSDSLKSRGDTKRLCDKGSGSRERSLTRTSTIICQRDWGDSPSNAKEVDEENQPSLVEKDKSCKRLLE
ncbi:hypothetical protein Bca4012_069809 [Brassica carinata]